MHAMHNMQILLDMYMKCTYVLDCRGTGFNGQAYKLSQGIIQQVLFNLGGNGVEQYPAVGEHFEELLPGYLPPWLHPLCQHSKALCFRWLLTGAQRHDLAGQS